jgi:hypothetical protein
VTMDNVTLNFDKWTKYPGGVFDNRPTTAVPDIETHKTPGIIVRHADNVTLNNCSVTWGKDSPEYFTYAIETEDVSGFKNTNFKGNAAHPARDKAIVRH